MCRWMVGLVLCLAMTGCATDQDNDTPPMKKPMPERIDKGEAAPPTPVTGEVPAELLDAIKTDLAARRQASVDDIGVVRAQAVIWRDGSLGCPEPGMMYTQALVNGYWVVLDLHGTQYDYRAGHRAHFKLCEKNGKPPYSGDPQT